MVGQMLMKTQIVDLLAFSFFSIAFALSITYLLFKFNFKTSLHTLGIGGIIGFVIVMSYEYQLNFNLLIAGLFILSGLIAFSRLKLNAHTPKEIYFGFIIGFLTQIGSLSFCYIRLSTIMIEETLPILKNIKDQTKSKFMNSNGIRITYLYY